MGYYLLDNPPASQQFWPSRNNGVSGGVVIHTTEGAGGDVAAENTAAFIARRSNPGSYHCIVDDNSTVMMLPDDYTAFGVGASGFNSRCWMIAIAANSADLNPDDPATFNLINRVAVEIVDFWRRNGVDVAAASQFIGDGVKDLPGLAHHGDVQPWDRSDAWSRRPDRWIFDSALLQAIERYSGSSPVSPPEPTQPVPVAPETVLSIGSSGDKVREIQKIVGVREDGVFGPQTQSAVRQWQSNLGIVADGAWGPQTEQATHDLFVFLSNLSVVQEINPNNEFFQAVEEAKAQVIRQGSSGGAVKIAQLTLNSKGYRLVGDGVFGPATDSAVRRFQSDNGISVDGIVGPRTWATLLS